VNIRLLTDPATQAGEVFPTLTVTFHTAVDGSVPNGVFVATPDSDAWRYRVSIHGNSPFEVYLAGTGDISLDDLIALAGIQGTEAGTPQYGFWLAAWQNAQTADPTDVLTPAGEWVPAATGGIPEAPGTGVHGRGGGVWTALGSAATANTTAFDPAGSAATVQGNLNTHTGDGTIHFTQAAISITPAQAGADAAGSAATVQGNLNTHTGDGSIHFTQAAISITPAQAGAGTVGTAVFVAQTGAAALVAIEPVVTASVNANYAIDGNTGSTFNLTLTTNPTLSFTNLAAGRVITVNIVQDGVGNRVPVWSGVSWGTAGAPTLRTGINDRDKLVFSSFNGTIIDGHLINQYDN
jgi:hypothetical protein